VNWEEDGTYYRAPDRAKEDDEVSNDLRNLTALRLDFLNSLFNNEKIQFT
jgi:hypothetical protein